MTHTDKAKDVDLPPADTERWSPRRKARVVNAVSAGAIGREEACRRYRLSIEEFLSWQEALATHGIGALRVTRLQLYRRPLAVPSGERRDATG
jgi:hypothetical protein